MSRIIAFLGDGSQERTISAIATAKWFAQTGKRVILATYPNPRAEIVLGTPLNTYPQVIDDIQVVQLQSTVLLEQVWQELKPIAATYLPDSLSEEVYPGELIVLPGMDSILAFNALREYYVSGDYDVIIYDGQANLETLRMLGIPGGLNWYFHRLNQVFEALDISKIAASFGGPLASAILAANVDSYKIKQGLEQVRSWIEQGVAVVSDASRLTAYLVTMDEPGAIAQARWIWGSAQQVNLTVSGVLAYQCQHANTSTELQQAFAPLTVSSIPAWSNQNWEPILQALPNFNASISVPQPLTFDIAQRQVLAFLPGFNKKQVKLTQYGSEIVITAGDQRRKIALPPELLGGSVKAGKFEEPYLTISF